MAKNTHLNFNVSAPDLTLLTPDREPVNLSSLWAEKPVLLAFTRHFGCTQCKEMLEELVIWRERIIEAGLKIVVVMQGSPEMTAIFAEQFAPNLLCLSDQERKAYRAYGLERGNLFQTFLNPQCGQQYPNLAKRVIGSSPPCRSGCHANVRHIYYQQVWQDRASLLLRSHCRSSARWICC